MNQAQKKWLQLTLIWLCTLSIGFYIRLYPLRTYTSFEATEKASLLVMSNLKRTVTETVTHTYPGISGIKKQKLIDQQFARILREQKGKAIKTITNVARDLDKDNPPDQDYPYLLASDSFYYYSLTENIQKAGRLGGPVKGSKYLNTFMLAPEGHWEPLTLHPYVGYGLHKILTFFSPDIPLMYSVSFVPLVITALALIPYLLICSSFGLTFWPTLAGSVYFLLAPIFLKRSTFGWYDNDPYNGLFPLLILAVFFIGLTKKLNKRSAVTFGLLCSLSIALYALFWQGWVFLAAIIFLSTLIILLTNHFVLRKKEDTRWLALYFSCAVFGSFAGVALIFGINEFFVLFQEGWKALQGFMSPKLSLWPDMYLGVAELKRADFSFIVEQIGGYVVFCVALLGVGRGFFRSFRAKTLHPFPLLTLTTFLVLAFLMTLGAERFVLLCLIPFALLFPVGLQYLAHLIETAPERIGKNTALTSLLGQALVAVLSVGLLITPMVIHSETIMPGLLNKIYNDTWNKALTTVREQTPKESIVNTWWPPGHFIKAIAHRRVTFDGATINVPQSYWMANVFISPDERRALGILRMLNNSANQAADFLVDQGYPLSQSVDLLDTILPLNRAQAAAQLQDVLSGQQINELLRLTHVAPPPSYLMIYNDFVDKNIQLAFVGKWDFRKVEDINANPDLRENVPSSRSKQYINFLWTIAGGQPKISDPLKEVGRQGQKIIFENNIIIDLQNKLCRVSDPEFGTGTPARLLYLEGDQLVEKELPQANLPYSVLLIRNPGSYQCLLADTGSARSLLFHLYYFGGKGLKYFVPFTEETDLTGRTKIIIYKVNWERFLEDIGDHKEISTPVR